MTAQFAVWYFLIPSYIYCNIPLNLNKVHTGAAMSAPYISQHTDIDSEGRKKEEYDKKDDLNFARYKQLLMEYEQRDLNISKR